MQLQFTLYFIISPFSLSSEPRATEAPGEQHLLQKSQDRES